MEETGTATPEFQLRLFSDEPAEEETAEEAEAESEAEEEADEGTAE